MYIKLKDGRIVKTDNVCPNTIVKEGMISWTVPGGSEGMALSEIERITDERPVLVNTDAAAYQAEKYLVWSTLGENLSGEDNARVVFVDLMDYLTHTKQILTPAGFEPIPEKVTEPKKVQVVYSHMLRDGGTLVYMDKPGNEYYVLAPHYKLKGVYRKLISGEETITWDDVRMWGVELEILNEFPSPLKHRDDGVGY